MGCSGQIASSEMKYPINHNTLSEISKTLSKNNRLFWIVGGAGSGKSTICSILSKRFEIPVYDMDAHIYGSYHKRFTKERHPANFQWTNSQNSLEWLLKKSWEAFNSFNQSALVEYLDLLAEDIQSNNTPSTLLIDGGICNPGLLAQALPSNQIVCLSRLHNSSKEIWEENEERLGMKQLIDQLKEPENAWEKFLEFDAKITQTILDECQASNIAICVRDQNESPTTFSDKVASLLNLENLEI